MKKFGREIENGPFAKARRNVEEFSSNIYYIHLLQESLDQLEEAQSQYDTALSSSDERRIASTKIQLEVLQSIFEVATAGFNINEQYC